MSENAHDPDCGLLYEDGTEHCTCKLLPCPFCGGEAIICPDTGYASAMVFCPDSNDCPVNPSADADLAIGETVADAVRRWNTRLSGPSA